MKVLNSNYLFYFALISTFLFSCTSIKQSEEESTDTSLSYSYKTFRITSSKPLSNSDTTYFFASYPEFSDLRINDYVQKHLVLDSGENSIAEMGEKFIMDYDKFYDEVEFKRPWYEDKRDSVEVETESYIGFSTHFENYTGGAHGNHYVLYNNYSIKENRAFSLEDIVNKNSLTKLTKIAEKIFREQEGISETHSLTDGYFFENGIFSLPNNFILQKDSILFLYNIYEIKPYVDGDTKLLIPYESIEDLFTAEGNKIITEIENTEFNASI